MRIHTVSAFAAVFSLLFSSGLLAGELSGNWVMRTQYDGKQTSELQVSIFQNGSELIFISKASSNKGIPGHGSGRVTRTEKGSETIASPVGLVEMTRVDGVGSYVAKFIGVIASSAKISGYFVDVNGRGGGFAMEKQVGKQ